MRAAIVLVCLAVCSVTALAQPAPSSQPSTADDKRTRAKERFFSAEASYQSGEYQKALVAYQEAYELSKEPALLYNVGQCHYKLAQYEKALASYKEYLRLVPNSPLRADLERLLIISEGVRQEPPKTPTKPTPPTTPEGQVAYIYAVRDLQRFVVQVSSGEKVFHCAKEVTHKTPCALKGLPVGKLTLQVFFKGSSKPFEESFQMIQGGVQIQVAHRGTIRRILSLGSFLIVTSLLTSALTEPNPGTDLVVAAPFAALGYWSARPKFRAWNKVTVTPLPAKPEKK